MGFFHAFGRTTSTRGPRSVDYYCTNDLSPCSWTAVRADALAFGCMLCVPPTRYADLDERLKGQIPLADLRLLWTQRILCRQHNLAIVPRCAQCGARIDEAGNTPPVGIIGLSASGKSVYCAALYLEFENLHRWTGIRKRYLSNPAEYEAVLGPLRERGVLPAKTRVDGQRSLVLMLSGAGWPGRKVTLIDRAGEIGRDLFPGGDEAAWAQQRELMLRTPSAILLASPESCLGLGAASGRDPFPAVQRIVDICVEAGLLGHLSRLEAERVVRRIEDIVVACQYPIRMRGGFSDLAAAAAASLTAQPDPSLVSRLDDELGVLADHLTPKPLTHQLDGLATFLEGWGYPRVGRKLGLRIALTISKADVLDGVCPDYGPLLAEVGPASRPAEWERTLDRVSAASRAVLLAHGEADVVACAEEHFHDVGFFFVSSLGRGTETFVQESGAPRRLGGLAMPALLSGAATGAAASGAPRPAWELGKRLRRATEGGYQPRPRHVLLPLLWQLAREAR